jgi:transcriptional regulator with XRE-family HTH domain
MNARRKFKHPLLQEALAVRLELDGWKIRRGTLSKIEAGIRRVTGFEVVALARTLKVSPDWLMDKQLFESMLKKQGLMLSHAKRLWRSHNY